MDTTHMDARSFRAQLFGERLMGNHTGGATQRLAPEINAITDEHLFEGVWQDDDLTLRERTLITTTAMVSLGQERELGFHIQAALRQGVSPVQIVALIKQLMFYVGLPKTHLALRVADEVFAQQTSEEHSR